MPILRYAESANLGVVPLRNEHRKRPKPAWVSNRCIRLQSAAPFDSKAPAQGRLTRTKQGKENRLWCITGTGPGEQHQLSKVATRSGTPRKGRTLGLGRNLTQATEPPPANLVGLRDDTRRGGVKVSRVPCVRRQRLWKHFPFLPA